MNERFRHLQMPTEFEFRQKTLSYQLEVQSQAVAEVFGNEHVVTKLVQNLLCDWKDNDLAQSKIDDLCSNFSADVRCSLQKKMTDIVYRDAHCPGCGGSRL